MPADAGRVQQLLPLPTVSLPLQGLYLDRESPRLQPPAGVDVPLVYANFVTSLDGRIAVGGDEASSRVPPSITTRADWRLFQELQAHADAVITHGGYLRDLAAGRLGDILQVGLRDDTADLLAWRRRRGISGQPAVIVASASLDFPLPPSLREHGQRVVIVTVAGADERRIAGLRARGIEVRVTEASSVVPARSLVRAAADLGCRRLYLQSGPLVLEDMLREQLLQRLYLTISTRLVGGEAFHSLIGGPQMGARGRLALDALYYFAGSGESTSHLFTSYEVVAEAE